MADPTPGRDGFDRFADELAAMRRRIDDLESASGTQRGQTSEKTDATLAYLAGLESLGSTGTSSVTLTSQPADGTVRWFLSFRVNDANGKTVIATGARTGRLYFNQRFGAGISTGPSLVTIDTAQYSGPFTITPLIGIWGQNTGSGQNVGCVYNNPSLRVEIIGNGVY